MARLGALPLGLDPDPERQPRAAGEALQPLPDELARVLLRVDAVHLVQPRAQVRAIRVDVRVERRRVALLQEPQHDSLADEVTEHRHSVRACPDHVESRASYRI
jgi:hypothetical protein